MREGKSKERKKKKKESRPTAFEARTTICRKANSFLPIALLRCFALGLRSAIESSWPFYAERCFVYYVMDSVSYARACLGIKTLSMPSFPKCKVSIHCSGRLRSDAICLKVPTFPILCTPFQGWLPGCCHNSLWAVQSMR